MLDVNEYFDGKVKSIRFQSQDLPATIGVMAPGLYEFCTSKKETMTIISGAMSVMQEGDQDWHTLNSGEIFIVAANETFQVRVSTDTAYLCTYE